MKIAKITFRLARPKAKQSVIVAQCYVSGEKINNSTGIIINCSHWLQKSQLIKSSCANSTNINQELSDYRHNIENIMYDLISKNRYSKSNVLRRLNNPNTVIDSQTDYDVINYFELFKYEYIPQHKAQNGTIECHVKSRNILENFNKTTWNQSKPDYLSLHDINSEEFYDAFYLYLNKVKKYSVGYTDNQIKNLKALMHHAVKKCHITNFNAHFYPRITEEIEPIYLSLDDIKLIENVELKTAPLRASRDWMLVTCATGMRVSDFMNLETRDISNCNKLIQWRTKKTFTPVSTPINSNIKGVLTRNDGFPKKMCAQKFNYYIKQVCKEAGITYKIRITRKIAGVVETRYVPKYEKVSAHTGRRSMATNMYLKGVAPHKIKDITGHKSVEMLMKYIKVDAIQSALEIGEDWDK